MITESIWPSLTYLLSTVLSSSIPVTVGKFSFFFAFPKKTKAQMVNTLPTMQETWVQSLGLEDSLEKGMATPPVFLPEKSHGQRSLMGYSPWGCKDTDMTDRLTLRKKTEALIRKDTCPPSVHSSVIYSSQWKQPKCRSADKRIRKLWRVYMDTHTDTVEGASS